MIPFTPEEQFIRLERVLRHVYYSNPGPISINRDSKQQAIQDLKRLIRKLDLTIPEFIEEREAVLKELA
jgi:hypothetical protein